MFNLLKWLTDRKRKGCAEETPPPALRLVDPPTVERDDFAVKFDKVVKATEGDCDD